MSPSTCIEIQPQLALRPAPLCLLTVGVGETDHSELVRFLKEPECSLYRASARRDALPKVVGFCPDVVICEQSLPDGTWQDLLGDLQCFSRAPMLIVCSLLADDRLWAEVLNIGGYDVLMKPFLPIEVTRVVRMAARQVRWKRQSA
jgi:DNA-binding response OmpR family regulator